MSTTSSRRTRRSVRTARGASDDTSDIPAAPGSSVSGSDLYSDVGAPPPETRSGLRTSEVEMSSPLSYGDAASSLDNWERSPSAQAAAASSTVRPGVRDEGSRAAPLVSMPTSSSTGHVDESSSVGPGSHTVIWGTDVNVAKVMDRFKRFLQNFKTEDLSEEAMLITGREIDPNQPLYMQKLADMAASGVTSLEVDCRHLHSYHAELHQQLITYPKEVIPACDSAAHQLFMEVHREIMLERPIQIRPYNCVGRARPLRQLNPEDLEQLLSVSGMVIRLSSVIPEMMRAHFECSVCAAVKLVVCERGRVEEPRVCDNCNAAYTFRLVHNRCLFADKQMIKLQEAPEDMPAGQTPHTVVAYAHEDLVDTVQPGDRVTVTGIFRANPLKMNPRMRSLKAVYRTFLDVIHFKKTSAHRLREDGQGANLAEDRLKEIKELAEKPDLYERLSSAIAPSIYENEDIKKGILLQLFGGRWKDFSAAGRGSFRSEINILLCGDPGTSKSQLLQYVYNLLPRGQYTSGKGSSAVGLTAYITKDPETRQLALQTGALVLADRGVCCIDEFDKMPDGTRSVLHEVMEQQTLSIAKAGIICQLNARTSVLAAANPIGSKWDNKRTIIDNIQLPHTLLSRFDLIFLILDPQDEVYDARLARHLVSLYYKTPEAYREEFVSMDLLRDFIAFAKEKIHPRLTEEAQQYLIEEYVEMRKLGSGRGQVSAYPRQLESLIRLAEAHARMRLSNEVTADDCREARRLQREALKQAATDPTTGMIDVNILATGVSSSLRKRREEVAVSIWTLLSEKGRVLTFTYQRVFEELKGRSERAISRELFEDGLNVLKNENKIDWAGNTIRKR